MKKIIVLFCVLLNAANAKAQLKKFCAQDNNGNKYEISLIEGSGTAITRTYSSTGTLKNEISGTFSRTDEGVYGSAYFITILLPNGNMKFLASYDAEGKVQELKDVSAGRVFYACNNSNSSIDNTNDDGSKYSFNKEKAGINREITIGNKVWSSENLNVNTFRNGDSIQEAKTNEEWNNFIKNRIPSWCYYNNESKNGEIYGKLYNWYAFNDPRGLAPIGWSIPNKDDWNSLTSTLGGGSVYSRVGNEIKKRGVWAESNISDESKFSNTSGFSAMPSGFRLNGGSFSGEKFYSAWWIAGGEHIGVSYNLHNTTSFNSINKQCGLSVRLIKDNELSQYSKLDFVKTETIITDRKSVINKYDWSKIDVIETKSDIRFEVTFNLDANYTSSLRKYTNNELTFTINGNWKFAKDVDGSEIINLTYMQQTSGGYESTYGYKKFTFKIIYNNSKEIESLIEPTIPNKFYKNVSTKSSKNNNIEVKNIVNEPIIKSNEIIGNSIKIGSLEIAEFDLSSDVTKSKDAENACYELGDSWRLPTVDELAVIFENKNSIKGLMEDGYYYWSSTKTNLGESKVSYYYRTMGGFSIGYANRFDKPRARIVRIFK